MTALTPDDLARIEELAEKALQKLRHAVMRWEDDGGDIEAIIWHDFADPLLAGVRSLQTRITELEQERDNATRLATQNHAAYLTAIGANIR